MMPMIIRSFIFERLPEEILKAGWFIEVLETIQKIPIPIPTDSLGLMIFTNVV
jgi:hypothetical protein